MAGQQCVGGKGNEGVSYVKQLKGAIGYVELSYALQNKMAHAGMQNAAGNWCSRRPLLAAAAESADWEIRQGLQPGHQRARRPSLADHRDQLHPDAQGAARRRRGEARRRTSSAGLGRTAPNRRNR